MLFLKVSNCLFLLFIHHTCERKGFHILEDDGVRRPWLVFHLHFISRSSLGSFPFRLIPFFCNIVLITTKYPSLAIQGRSPQYPPKHVTPYHHKRSNIQRRHRLLPRLGPNPRPKSPILHHPLPHRRKPLRPQETHRRLRKSSPALRHKIRPANPPLHHARTSSFDAV